MTEESIVTFDMLVQKILNSEKSYDVSKITSAFQFADKAHEGQFRSSGQPYIIHPLAVADILLDLGMDTDTICAALLHDVVEDTPATYDQLRRLFGLDVANLVDGVTKLTKTPFFNKEEKKAEDIYKIMFAMARDTRVMIIKLCDRLHNMRTLKYRPEYKQQNTAYETMTVYVPIARRLGIKKLQEELETLSCYYLDPYGYSEVERLLEISKEERESLIESIKERIAEKLKDFEFQKEPKIEGRVKSLYGIYKKLYTQNKKFDQIYDKYAVRVIVTTVAECYNVLGIIHDMFRPLVGRFKDYISTPKENMYQSLHTTVLGREGIPFEVQIRTWEMHMTAEYGIAAHWKYKEGVRKDKMEKRLAWIRQLLEAQKTSDDVTEIVSTLKNDLSSEEIIVITPKGDVISLPVGSTPIDFAYKIHTQIGHRMMGAKVDGSIVPLDYELQMGQICEVMTSRDPDKGPNRAWLDIAKTTEAKSKIRSWFKKERREENIETGRTLLEREWKRCHIRIPEEDYETFLIDDMRRHNCNTLDDFYASIGYGGISIQKLLPRWKEMYHKLYCQDETEEQPASVIQPVIRNTSHRIILDDIQNLAVKWAQCCNPLPGDDIVGYITRGYGLSVHTASCVNYKAMLGRNLPEEKERWVEVQWTENQEAAMQTSIEIIAIDRVGLMFDITAILTEARIPIIHSSSRNLKNGNAIIDASIKIVNKSQLTAIFDKIHKVKGVLTVERASN